MRTVIQSNGDGMTSVTTARLVLLALPSST
jgi:hypothetical protein